LETDRTRAPRGGPLATVERSTVDAASLAADLHAVIEGEVRFDEGSRALYATDGSNYRQVPIGVVLPRSKNDIIETVAAARRHGAPIIARGGGTSLAGQCCNVAVMMDMSKYLNRVIEIDAERKLARVEPGTVLDELRSKAEEYGLTFGPDPATHRWCTLGGMIGNNSCGTHSVMAGRTSDNIEELEILTYDGLRLRVGKASGEELEKFIREGGRRGEIYGKLRDFRDRYAPLIRERFPELPRRVSGYNLPQLLPENGFHVARALVGSECTCVVVLEATTKLVHSPPARALVVLGFEDVFRAADRVPEALRHDPVGLEGLDNKFIEGMRKKRLLTENLALMPEGGGYLLVEFGGETEEEAVSRARGLMDDFRRRSDAPTIKLFDDAHEQEKIWAVRESGLGATAHIPGENENWEGWEDSAVRPDRLGDYARDFSKLLDRYEYTGAIYGHFGDGCLHTRIDFGLKTSDGIRKFRSFIEDAADLVVKHGGSFSGEHGDGQSRAELLPKMFGEELVGAFNEFKAIWDPEWKMNPGKLVRPFRLDENLRYGPDYNRPDIKTHFKYPDDHSSFANAMERCVGVGACRKIEKNGSGGTMCPSYMVTREEMHTTRGRARLLWEMLEGDPLRDGFQGEHVKEALDLCLACKGCKAECPVQVDMATYKAEFLSHYYEHHWRPRHAWAFGLIHTWARMASIMPSVSNFFTQTPMLGRLAKFAAGVAPQRRIPVFAPQTFKAWFRKRTARSNGLSAPRSIRNRVILWPDTFNNNFHPETARAAVEVLEAVGCEIVVPTRDLCCGRPLYDFGLLDMAEQRLLEILDALAPEIEAGTPLVVLEPSCAAVFRDELTNLLPTNMNAQRLREQTFLLSEFLVNKIDSYAPPRLERGAVVHGHCHQKALMKMENEHELMKRLGLDFEILDSGCCGMAGAFGFERSHYDISIACGERVLLPAVREAAKDTLIIADGFSCREQIAQTTDRRSLHLAEVIRMAIEDAKR
jgi:FAD/FMN-containing dehydrogenase/Fe-S oxidoreductase